ncbi:hypothetical protein MMC07_002078 [Pseudocyphellaria aurata]|nr:hypothetical protein [Pseudocyphellaria aurata]
MSSSAQGGSGGAEDKPQKLAKFMRRASKVLKRGGSSSRGSDTAVSDAPPAESRSTTSAKPISAPLSGYVTFFVWTYPLAVQMVASPGPVATPVKPEATTVPSVAAALQQSIKDTKPSIKLPNHRHAKTAAASHAIQEEKARTLFAKYGLTLEPGEWMPPARGDAERIEKKIRMRVHRTCHRCATTFGAEKICNNCQHTRCKKCPRYPAKKSKDPKDKGKGLSLGTLAISTGDTGKGSADLISLTMPSRVTGKELTRRGPVQRVRRTCHKCETLFEGKSTQCETCKHLRCPKCPREPPKLDKYPHGYPGDTEETFPLARRELRSIRTHVRWTCHECNTLFQDTETTCGNCSHKRCGDCPREPPKTPPEPSDEEAVQSIERKMKGIAISPQASASAA